MQRASGNWHALTMNAHSMAVSRGSSTRGQVAATALAGRPGTDYAKGKGKALVNQDLRPIRLQTVTFADQVSQ